MAKTYFNDAIVGNSHMLACLSGSGELVRLFWPNIDYPQHTEKFAAGIFDTAQKHSTLWLHEHYWQHNQYYITNTNILVTVCSNIDKGIRVLQTDYVLIDKDVLVRSYEIENTGVHEMDLGFMVYSSAITTNPELRSTLFDFNYDALVHYRHGYYISLCADREAYQFQLGNNALDAAAYTELGGYDSIGMMSDGAVSWKLGAVRPGEKKRITVSISASTTLKGVRNLMKDVKNSDPEALLKDVESYWKNFLSTARQIASGNEEIDLLYKRSLLVFKLMTDETTGGLLAAPEIDEEFTKCGRYAYCWGRDAAFITGALDRCGLTGAVDKFYQWAVDVQDEDGSWHQRYHMDGNLAPSWGLQIDETGTLVWGMLKHYEITGNSDFLRKVWNSVRKAVEFILAFMDPETGLPAPSFDLWEERQGEHAYSSAAVYGGVKSGAAMARILGMDKELVDRWETAAEGIKQAIVRNFWKEDRRSFIRSVRTKLNPWGSEYTHEKVLLKVNPKGYLRDYTLEDGTADVSLLGIAIPFEVFDVEDGRVEGTVENIERTLAVFGTGGIKRYENDNYMGGNPWVLTTLWLALYYIRRKQYHKAKSCFDWAVRSRTRLGLLPEQVNKDTGEPGWVIPLTWSHAMFVLVLIELADAGVLQDFPC